MYGIVCQNLSQLELMSFQMNFKNSPKYFYKKNIPITGLKILNLKVINKIFGL